MKYKEHFKVFYHEGELSELEEKDYPENLQEDFHISEFAIKLYKYDVCNRLIEKQTRRLLDNVTDTSVNTGKTINLEKSESVKPQGNHNREAKLPTVSGRQDNLIPFQTSTFQYDNQGNLLREERKTGESRQKSIYSYDGFNRQKKIVNFESKV